MLMRKEVLIIYIKSLNARGTKECSQFSQFHSKTHMMMNEKLISAALCEVNDYEIIL